MSEEVFNMSYSRFNRVVMLGLLIVVLGILGYSFLRLPPQEGFGGIFWFKGGFHYLSASDVDNMRQDILEPIEQKLMKYVNDNTENCKKIEIGFCKQSTNYYVEKKLVKPAVKYKAAVADRKEIVGYCTLCNDGTFSPSCAVGSGACSWHGGVASYGVARYRVIKGTAEVKARSAEYSYTQVSYKDSPLYIAPKVPTFAEIAAY